MLRGAADGGRLATHATENAARGLEAMVAQLREAASPPRPSYSPSSQTAADPNPADMVAVWIAAASYEASKARTRDPVAMTSWRDAIQSRLTGRQSTGTTA
jgi:hypothetical protein